LSDAQRLAIIDDAIALSQLHAAVWASSDAHLSWWSTPMPSSPLKETLTPVIQPA